MHFCEVSWLTPSIRYRERPQEIKASVGLRTHYHQRGAPRIAHGIVSRRKYISCRAFQIRSVAIK